MGQLTHDGLAIPGRVVLARELPFSLGPTRVHPPSRQVEADGRTETLEPRVMQVLVALARADGAIVTRDELVERCWDGRIVGDDAINRALSRVRRVGAGIGGGSFAIETITKVGYRLKRTRRDEVRRGPAEEHVPEPPRLSVCVLPFVNMNADPEQEYFSDGISEDITTDLSKVSALEVTARNTAFTFKGRAVDVRDLARTLGVSHVLEGSVRKADNRVRISAQLIDGATGNHVWAERYDRDITDIFAIQDEISAAIIAALKLTLLSHEKRAIEQRGTSSAEAYDFYLMARQYWIAGDFGDRRREERVIRLCERAAEIDPTYAQAWALMAISQSNLFRAYVGTEPLDDGSAAARRALALDPGIAEAHIPTAWHLAMRGRLDETNAELATALRLGSDSWEVNKEAARIFYRQRRTVDSAELLEKATTLAETDLHSWGMLAACYTALGDTDAVKRCAGRLVDRAKPVLAQDADNGAALAFGALGLVIAGRTQAARQWVDRALLLDADNLYMRYNLAWPLLTIWKDEKAALEMLEPCLATAGVNLVSLAANDPNLDLLRSNPRFQSMMSAAIDRVQLPPGAIVLPVRN